MRPYAFTGQSLSQHIKGVVVNAERMLDSGYIETLFRRLRYAGLESDRERICEAIRAAAVFHDVGKAVEYYQEQFDEEGRCKKPNGPSFYLHEVISAVYFDRFLVRHNRWTAELKTMTTLAVLNHMHSLRDYGRKLNLFSPQDRKPLRELEIIEGARITRDDLESLAEVIAEYGFDSGIVRQCLAAPVSYEKDVYSLGKKLRNFESSSQAVRLYALLLLPIVVGDVLDAVENRPGELTTSSRRFFVEELRHCLREDNYG